jgi:hypothetical protein
LLWEVKGGGQGQAISKAEVTQAADAILQPLMDLLDGMIKMKDYVNINRCIKMNNLIIINSKYYNLIYLFIIQVHLVLTPKSVISRS